MRSVLLWFAVSSVLSFMPAAADSLTLHNCSDVARQIAVYNEGDGLCWIARSQTTLHRCGTVTFDCAGKCKVKGVTGATACSSLPLLSGARVIPKRTGEELKTTAELDRWRGTPNWSLLCTCTDAEMQF
jgi:hypothetical protein